MVSDALEIIVYNCCSLSFTFGTRSVFLTSVLLAARAGGKFRPKAKQRPTKVASVLVPSILPSNAKEKAVASSPTFLDTAKSVQPVDVVDDRLTSPVGTKESLKSNDAKKVCESVEGSMNFVTQLDAKRADLASDVAVSDGSSDRHSSLLVRKVNIYILLRWFSAAE